MARTTRQPLPGFFRATLLSAHICQNLRMRNQMDGGLADPVAGSVVM